MGETQPLSGPDFAQGIPLADLTDGGMVVGHAQGEAVLLVRQGNEFFAIGATCTHYSGPLAEGVIVGDTVRCPWHHACFSLRTGEAVRAPALNPVQCWTVERRGDRAYVTGRRIGPPPRTPPAPAPESVVIVGAGAAGNAAAETLRREGFDGRVTLIGAEDSVPCDRPNLSKDYLAGTASEDWIPLRSREFYAEQGIDLRLGVAVGAIEPSARRVTLVGGETVDYGALLLATGADPIRLPLPGADLPHVGYLRTLADSRAIIERATSAKRALVLGASFIGLEVAASLRHRGLEVHVAAPEARPLERIMGPEIGDFVRALHEEHGVVFHLGQTAKLIDPRAVTLANGDRVPADLVVIGAGVRPVLTLAEQAGLTLDRGVVVDEYLETSRPGIFAAGDIARWPDPRSGERIRVEHWVVAERQGQTAARNILGRRERFDAVPFFWSQHYDVVLAYVGHAERWDRIDVAGSIHGRDCTLSYVRGGKVLAVLTIFRDRASLLVEAAMEANDTRALDAALVGR